MATIATNTTSRTTAIDLPTAAVSAAGGGDKFTNDGSQLLYIQNTDTNTVTLTVVVQATLDGQTVTNRTYSIAQNERKVIGPFTPNIYNDANTQVNITYSAVTALKVAVFKTGN